MEDDLLQRKRMEDDLLLQRKRMEEVQCLLQRILDGAEDPTDLPLQLLKDITNDFSKDRKIGQGGFGAVYKGVLGELVVAVKKIYVNIYNIDDDDKQFGREFNSLCNTNHRNVVRFLGFCSTIHQKRIRNHVSGEFTLANVIERLFCFEYISNGSLDKHISDELRGLEWEARYEIIIGICKGLRYLHEEKNIIHMDLKPANILLGQQDGKYRVPKITDFGLSRPNEKSYTKGKVYGTRGYCAPEYREGSKTTLACDIYSLGAIIRELVTGCMEVPNKDNVLRRWRHRWRKPPTLLQYQQVTRCIEIAGRCRAKKPKARPSISKIISFLSDSESTYGQISPCLDKDDMLRITPLKLQLPSELKNEISRWVELTNDTLYCIAFNIQPPSVKYIAQPIKGTVQPQSKCHVKIIVQPRDVDEHNHADKFTVQSIKWSEGLREEDITERMSCAEARKAVDEVDLMVIYETTNTQDNCKRRGYTNMPAEKVPKAKRRKKVDSYPGKGKQKLGSCENAEATSLDINSSAQGQYILHPPQCFSRHYPTNDKYLGKESDRAVDVARGAMGSLLDKLGKLVTEDYSLGMSTKRDIESFSEDLTNMHRDLQKLENVDGAKIWVREVRELSYNVEDMVDSFCVHVEPDSSTCGFRELTPKGLKFLVNGMPTHNQIDDVITDIKSNVKAVAKKKCNIEVNDYAPNTTMKDPRMAMYRNIEQPIGIEAPRKELIAIFEAGGKIEKQELRIVSIVGLGGLGKTTLAKAVYEDDEIQAQYQTRAFVPVGQNPDLAKVLKKIIRGCQGKKYSEEKMGHFDETDLISELHDFLNDKRYFIVIDDLWGCPLWDIVNSAFPRNKCGSRVITTSRSQEVVDRESWRVENTVYRIKQLSDEYSRRLFFRRISGPTPRKEEISKDILKRCGGMPFAINIIASHLDRNASESSWEYARKSFCALTGNDIEKMKQILDLSYIHLPGNLRTCLLHVCMYPEDCEIDKNDLLRQWVAEGFVSTVAGLDAEDVAENYLKELIDMSMIQPEKIDYYNNEVLSCRVHDIILELMRSKLREEKFIHVIDGLNDVSGQIRRVSVHCNLKEDGIILETIKGSLEHVRSVSLCRGSLMPYFVKFNYVRVLHLQHGINYSKVIDLTGISRLFLLRYLKIEWSQLASGELKLPDKIGQLQQLETIDLQGGGLKKYPSDIVSLPRLSHLRYSSYRGIMLPDGIERLKSLRTLEGVCVLRSPVDNIKGIGELCNLRNLEIHSTSFCEPEEITNLLMSTLHSSISKISTSLRILTLDIDIYIDPGSQEFYLNDWSRTLFPHGSHIRRLDLSGCRFETCPEWIGQLRDLYSLSIRVKEVANGVYIVASLPSLAYLEFVVPSRPHNEDKEETIVITGTGAFQTLKHLIFYCPNVLLTFEQGALPKLERLDMLFSNSLICRFLPVGIENLPSPTLKQISLGVSTWEKVKGSENSWGQNDWDPYLVLVPHYEDKLIKYDRKLTTLWKRAFKSHHQKADIYFCIQENGDYCPDPERVDCEEYCEEDGNEEHGMLGCL